jgi:hypothetical protein
MWNTGKRYEKKELFGPEIFSAGPLIDGSNPVWPGSFVLADPAQIKAAIIKIKEDGYDAIKVCSRLSPDVYDEIMKTGAGYWIPGFSLHREFELLSEAGLTPYNILLASTINPARILVIENRLGTVEPGKDADLVQLEKNPVEDIRNTKPSRELWSRGRGC